MVYEVPLAAMRNYHNLGGLNSRVCYLTVLEVKGPNRVSVS